MAQRPDGKSVCWKADPGVAATSCSSPKTPNPVRIVDRIVERTEVDYAHAADDLVKFERFFDGTQASDGQVDLTAGFGSKWRTNYNRAVWLNTFVSPNVLVHTNTKDTLIYSPPPLSTRRAS
jgi:hypothetical protein